MLVSWPLLGLTRNKWLWGAGTGLWQWRQKTEVEVLGAGLLWGHTLGLRGHWSILHDQSEQIMSNSLLEGEPVYGWHLAGHSDYHPCFSDSSDRPRHAWQAWCQRLTPASHLTFLETPGTATCVALKILMSWPCSAQLREHRFRVHRPPSQGFDRDPRVSWDMICTTFTAYRLTVTSALEWAMSQKTQACHLLTISSIPCRRRLIHTGRERHFDLHNPSFFLLSSGDFSSFRFSVSWNKAMPCPVEKRVSEHSRSSCSQKQVRFLSLFNDPSGPSTLAEFLCLVAYFFFSRRTMTWHPMHFEIESNSILQCIGGIKLYHLWKSGYQWYQDEVTHSLSP